MKDERAVPYVHLNTGGRELPLMDETGRVLAIDREARAEIVKLKQEMAELRAAIERIDKAVSNLLKDHNGNYSPTLKPIDDGWGHAENGWPWDALDMDATDGVTAGTRKPTTFTSE